MKIIVYHSSYGCDTGCCGHVVSCDDGSHQFSFSHPYDDEDTMQFAKDLIEGKFGKEHVADLDWEHCNIIND
jgi:hypothetical protein